MCTLKKGTELNSSGRVRVDGYLCYSRDLVRMLLKTNTRRLEPTGALESPKALP
jgi:hypothetical protein